MPSKASGRSWAKSTVRAAGLATLAVAGLIFAVAPPSRAQDRTADAAASSYTAPVVVELFTSQGCSKCPPADRLLSKLARRDDVLAISLHVDYWDYLGWEDTFASADSTDRQRYYQKMLSERTMYTPQMVIGGLIDIVGSDESAVESAIARARTGLHGSSVPITVTAKDDFLHVTLGEAPDGGIYRSGQVIVIGMSSSDTALIRRGENHGKRLTYHNVSRKLMSAGRWDGEPATFIVSHEKIMTGDADTCVVVLQDEATGAIFGAAKWTGQTADH